MWTFVSNIPFRLTRPKKYVPDTTESEELENLCPSFVWFVFRLFMPIFRHFYLIFLHSLCSFYLRINLCTFLCSTSILIYLLILESTLVRFLSISNPKLSILVHLWDRFRSSRPRKCIHLKTKKVWNRKYGNFSVCSRIFLLKVDKCLHNKVLTLLCGNFWPIF